ncbi:MAG TPA: hypothetical protein VMW64_09920 [Dehalococcoidia bacterium]|nr:hypothetical protein [Dehalococcoidia bacterium]
MEWYIILALAVGIFAILFPIAYVWYLNVGGVYSAIQKAREKRVFSDEEVKAVTPDTNISKHRIREVQVFRKASERGITQPIGRKEATKEARKANIRQPK